LLIAVFVTMWMGVIGLLDDFLKLQQKKRGEKNRGLVERYKLAGQFIVGPIILQALNRQSLHQVVREGTPDSHAGKGTTPTMGGLIILNSALISIVLWGRFSLSRPYLLIAIFVTLWMGVIGLLDDYLKLQQKKRGERNRGLVERYKLTGQVIAGLALGWYLWQYPLAPNLPGASTTLPFFKYYLVTPLAGFAWLYVGWVTFILTGTSNAVNITDGLDGLASGLSVIAFGTFAIFAYIVGRLDYTRFLLMFYLPDSGELTVFCLAMVGALIGFLWFNTHPAQVFMGDTGALALGGGLGAVAILLKSEFVLAFVGAVFVAEMMSVILQRYVFKYRRWRRGLEYAQTHRVFRRAPLHHHFEERGWKETQVVVRFWIIGILCAFFALSTLKLR
ncbi:MAG TPA: phospho-N-acetylmuramoyl-pentapeptide-transferase, partial [Gemmatimonadaceae bacterium]|nr:phospho-N-acetylmuramoyl-pentapeptide-transferase [Gemmatimonadaceae bacterium]